MNAADIAIPDEKLIELFSGIFLEKDYLAYYFDGNIDHRIVALLRVEQITVTDVYQQDQADEESDIRILSRARRMGCVTVTSDRDFREIHDRLSGLEGTTHPGIILIKSKTLKEDHVQLAAALIRLVDKYEGSAPLLRNQLILL